MRSFTFASAFLRTDSRIVLRCSRKEKNSVLSPADQFKQFSVCCGDFLRRFVCSASLSVMAYYHDQSHGGRPIARSIPELVQHRSVGRSIGESATERIPTTTTGSSQAQMLEEEMGNRFPQCRRGRPYSHTQALQALRFNPYNRRVPPPRTSSNRSTGKAFTHTMFVLDHGEDTIPRGPTRQFMYGEGRVVDFLELNTATTDKAMYEAIDNVFTNILPTQSEPK